MLRKQFALPTLLSISAIKFPLALNLFHSASVPYSTSATNILSAFVTTNYESFIATICCVQQFECL